MHARLCLCAAAAAIGLIPTAHAQNMLANGDLELPLDAPSSSDLVLGWTLDEPDTDGLGAPVDSATFTTFANHTAGGDRGLWLKSFQGGWSDESPESVNATLWQTVAGQAGQEYTLSAWFRFEANYTSAATTLALDFLDGDQNLLSNAFININPVNPKDSIWREFFVGGTAAPGTEFVRARIAMIDGVLAPANPQSAFVDDIRLVPTPASVALLSLGAMVSAGRRRARPIA